MMPRKRQMRAPTGQAGGLAAFLDGKLPSAAVYYQGGSTKSNSKQGATPVMGAAAVSCCRISLDRPNQPTKLPAR